jgi:hypothetical protein
METEPALAYAGVIRPRDVVAAAMAEPARLPPSKPAPTVEIAPDPIAARITAATEVAMFALPEPAKSGGDNPLARLAEIARIRAGKQDIIASARVTATETPRAAEAGWHIQIGAVPSKDAAQALIENARASMGDELTPFEPLTQAVEKNGTTLYRARFAGLSDKEQARAICAKLESKSIDCLALPN